MTGGSIRRAWLWPSVRQQSRGAALVFAVTLVWGCNDSEGPTETNGRAAAVSVAPQGGGPGSFVGRYVVRHGDDFDHGKGTFEPMLEVDDSTMLALDFGIGHKPSLNPGARVRLRGVRQGNTIAVEDGSSETLAPTMGLAAALNTTTTAVSLAPITKRIAVVLFNFSNHPTQPYTPEYAAGVAFTNSNSVAAYYKSNSWDSVNLVGDVYGWFTIPDSSTAGCNYSTWAASANKLAAAAGIDLSTARYEHIVYAFPSVSSCGFTGVAYMPGRQSWLNGTGGMSLRTMGHELGHNFATNHASTVNCTEGGVRVTLSANTANCTRNEYGDPFTIMGSGTRRNTNASLANFGWLPGANRLDVLQSGDYQIAPLYSSVGFQSLRIQRASSSYFALEFRQSGPFDTFSAGDPEVNGVTVRLTGSDANRTASQLLDMTPATTSFSDAALPVGKTFVDPLTNVSMTTLATSSAGADVRISFVPDQTPPSQPGNVNATPVDPYRIALSWAASTDNIGVSGYRISRNLAVVATVTGTSYPDAGLSPSTPYNYQVVAVDAAGNASSAASASATTKTPDLAPPSAPTGLTAALAKGGKVKLSWNPSTDDIAVAGYQVYKNGKLVATVTDTGYTDALGGGKNSSASYYVVAVDAAGNASAASTAVVVGG